MTAPIKSDRMEPFRLAKKCPDLATAEKRVLVAITDTCSMRDAECRKSAAKLDKAYGLPQRTLYDGLHGRRRKDGTIYYSGLLKRGLVVIKAGGFKHAGYPTTYGINLELLAALVNGEESSAQSSAQTSEELSTPSEKVQHNEAESSAQSGEKLSTGANKVLEVHPKVHQRERAGAMTETENPSLSGLPCGEPDKTNGNGTASGQKNSDERNRQMLDLVIARAKTLSNGKAQFSKTARKEMLRALRDSGGAYPEEIDKLILEKLKTCTDATAHAIFGSSLAADFVASVRSLRERAEEQKEQRAIKQTENAVPNWRAAWETAYRREEHVDLDAWMKKHPLPPEVNLSNNDYHTNHLKELIQEGYEFQKCDVATRRDLIRQLKQN
jgi:hypothetical protein